MEALRLLGIDREAARRIGLEIYKVGMVWPLAHDSALDFVRGKHEVLVIEEKRGLIESQFKEYFYDYPGRKPKRMVGKEDEDGNALVPWVGELSPIQLAKIVASRLDKEFIGLNLTARAESLEVSAVPNIDIAGATRTPYFCSGCPHNTSTRVPVGSQALAGIGCHFMASWMDRDTDGLIQMGGEGVNWITRSMFNGGEARVPEPGRRHLLPFRLARDPTGARCEDQYHVQDPVQRRRRHDRRTTGRRSDQRAERIAHSVRAEGVQRIALVSR